MDGSVVVGDVIVCRVNGTANVYVIGTVESGTVGDFSLRGMSTMVGRAPALLRAYDEHGLGQHVWLFDGAANGFVKTSRVAG